MCIMADVCLTAAANDDPVDESVWLNKLYSTYWKCPRSNLCVCVSPGLRSSYSCSVCSVVLNSIEQYHAHLQGSKHQNKWVPPLRTWFTIHPFIHTSKKFWKEIYKKLWKEIYKTDNSHFLMCIVLFYKWVHHHKYILGLTEWALFVQCIALSLWRTLCERDTAGSELQPGRGCDHHCLTEHSCSCLVLQRRSKLCHTMVMVFQFTVII